MAFECEVCFDTKSKRLTLKGLTTGNGDVLRSADCGHGICIECMSAFVTARVEEQLVFGICCPHEGCSNRLYDQDIERLAKEGPLEDAVCERFCELRRRDYTARASSFSEGLAEDGVDYGTMRRLWESTRLCPRCSIVIEKSQGCNSFFCICGFHFNYASAPRVVGNGIKQYDKVLDFAESHGLALSVAESLSGRLGLYAKAQSLASQVSVPLEEALDLQVRANKGDVAARARVRALRASARAACAAEEEDLPPALTAFDFHAGAAAEEVEPHGEPPLEREAPGPLPLARALSESKEQRRGPARLRRASSCRA